MLIGIRVVNFSEREEFYRPLSRFHNPGKAIVVTQILFCQHCDWAQRGAWWRSLVEELARLDLDRFGKPPQRRDFRIALPGLHPADLRGVDAAALRNLFLRQPEALTCLP